MKCVPGEGGNPPLLYLYEVKYEWLANTVYMGLGLINQKTTTATTTSVALFADYIGLRIRRPVTREILLFS